jgi:hypothetical protein
MSDATSDSEMKTCPATNREGEPCGLAAGWGHEYDSDLCKYHGGAADPEDQGAPEGNTNAVGNDGGPPVRNGNAETHGLTADRQQWFERHREDAEPIVRALVSSYVEDAPFTWQQTAKVDQLVEVAIDQARLRKSNEYLDEFLTEQTVSVTEHGQEITQLEENPAHMPRDRIKRTNLKILKELGVLDDPESASAAATMTLAEVLND